VNQPDLEHRWFGRHWVWVYPASRESEVQDLIAAGKTKYDDQPDWNFSEFQSRSLAEVEAILSEFSIVSHEASVAFEWMTNHTLHETAPEKWDIASYGWRHVSLRDLESKVDDIKAARGKSLLRQTAFAGESTEQTFHDLLADAREEKPEAVAKLWHRCQTEEKLRNVLRELYDWSKTPAEIEEIVQAIPNPVQLGTRYLERIFSNQGEESSKAREALLTLTSPGASQGTLPAGGQERRSADRADMRFIWAMSYSLVKQLLYTRTFLLKSGHRQTISNSLAALQEENSQFAELVQDVGFKSRRERTPDHELAYEIAAVLLNASPRNVKESRFREKRRKKSVH
jgi:hypothetical protein